MSEDLRAFAVAFSVVWGLLAAYLVYLHTVEVRLARELEALRDRLEDDEGKLK